MHTNTLDVDQLNQILGILGTPDEETLQRVGSERAQMYIRSLPLMPRIPFQNLYPRGKIERDNIIGY
jgi:mitogen-activated protein kinase 7